MNDAPFLVGHSGERSDLFDYFEKRSNDVDRKHEAILLDKVGTELTPYGSTAMGSGGGRSGQSSGEMLGASKAGVFERGSQKDSLVHLNDNDNASGLDAFSDVERCTIFGRSFRET